MARRLQPKPAAAALSPQAAQLIARLRAIDTSNARPVDKPARDDAERTLHVLAAAMDEAMTIMLESNDMHLTQHEEAALSKECRRVTRECNARLKAARPQR